jgi:hypothetical protein
MKLAKRTYSLPYDIIQRFENTLPPGDRSAFVAKLIENWLEEHNNDELRRTIIEGCESMSRVNREVNADWDSSSDALWRDLDPKDLLVDSIRRGDVLRVRLDPVEGSEQGGERLR